MLDITSTVKLRSGHEMPVLGFGVFQVEAGETCESAVRDALDAGYRHVDTAIVYRNEESVGQAIADSGIAREEIFITSKVFFRDFGREATRQACEGSLRRLGVDYLDLYLLHWPYDETMMGAWEALQVLRDEGKLRSIGVSNFTVRRFEETFLRRTDEVPAVNQVEFHPFWYREDLLDYCRSKGIQLEGYSPLARAQRMDEPTLEAIAADHGKSVAQVMIRWQLQHGMVVIPKSTHTDRIRENAEVFDFELSAAEMSRIDALNEDLCVLTWRPEGKWY